MSTKPSRRHTLKLAFDIMHQRGINKRFLIIFYSCFGVFALFAFTFLFTQNNIFALLMEITMVITATIVVLGIIWYIREVMKEIKKGNPPFSDA